MAQRLTVWEAPRNPQKLFTPLAPVLKISFGFENIDTEADEYKTKYNEAVNRFDSSKDKSADIDKYFSSRDINSTEEIEKWNEITKDAETAKEAIELYEKYLQEANKVTRSEMITNLNGLSEGFEELDKIHSSIQSDDAFDFKLLDDEKFKENFEGLGDVYADFVETVTSNPDDISKCKNAFNELVTEWVSSKKALDGIDDSNKKVVASMLKQMGVAKVAGITKRNAPASTFLQNHEFSNAFLYHS